MPAAAFEPHDRVAGKYRLRRRIAVGGMGEVWVARNESTDADVALKVLRRGDADKERELQIEERFRHEARLSATLSHRSIVKVFDLIEEQDGAIVVVMELLRGETLATYLVREGPRTSREAVAIVGPILSALDHAHQQGIVHRDVTPSNVFLAIDPDGHVTPKIVDFGIAKQASGERGPTSQRTPVQTLDGRVLGTPQYMSPEQVRGGEIDGRSDLFAVGVVLYEIVTGASPFAASAPSASLAAVLERHVDPDDRIEPRLWVEIQRAIAKNAYERHATAQEMAGALRAAIGETEGALAASLTRSEMPPGWGDGGESAPELQAGSQTIESVVVPMPRRGLRSAAWLFGGIAVAAIAAVAILGARAQRNAAATASVSVTPSAPTAASTIAASATSTPTPTSTSIATATPTASAVPAWPGAPIAPSAKPKPRAVATTPGF